MQYVERRFIHKLKVDPRGPSAARQIWDAVTTNKVQVVLRLLITGDANANTTFEQAMVASEPSSRSPLASLAGALSRRGSGSQSTRSSWSGPLLPSLQGVSESRSAVSSPGRGHEPSGSLSTSDASGATIKDLQGCTLLHIACQIGELNLVELLLQHGAQVNSTDSLGRTPLHHSILLGKNSCAKLLLTRYRSSCLGVHLYSTYCLNHVHTNYHTILPVKRLAMILYKDLNPSHCAC